MKATVEAYIDIAIKDSFPEISDHHVQLIAPNKSQFGDFQCNSAMPLAKKSSTLGKNVAPKEIASAIVSHIPENNIIDKVNRNYFYPMQTEIAGPGFINIWISKDCVCSELVKLLSHGVLPPHLNKLSSVAIDMSSPNVAKEMHVGHLRSTIIGESISRLLTFLGHRVLKLNHIGDWGTQFGMLIAHLKAIHPSCATPTSLSTIPPIGDLQALYKAAKAKFDTDEQFKAKAYTEVVKLQSGDAENTLLWNAICDVSRTEFNKVYARLNIQDLVERGESFYQSRMNDIVAELKSIEGALQLDEGRLLLWPPEAPIPLTVVKSDGGYTYDTSDLATLCQRLHEEKADWLIYVTDMGQATHFNTIFQAGGQLGFYTPSTHRVDHVGFGVVLGEDKKKFKTRSGESVRLIDLLDEGLERSKSRLIEKGRDKDLSPEEFKAAQEAIAYGCIKYADLSHTRTNDYIFSFDKMLDDKGNTAVYLLYAYTRIRSIIRNAGFTSDQLTSQLTQSITGDNSSPPVTTLVNLDRPEELALGKAICRLPDILLRCQQDYLLHNLCDYLYDLCCTFTKFYDACYCIERDRETGAILRIHTNRLLLCEATARVMKCGFDILGLQTVDKM